MVADEETEAVEGVEQAEEQVGRQSHTRRHRRAPTRRGGDHNSEQPGETERDEAEREQSDHAPLVVCRHGRGDVDHLVNAIVHAQNAHQHDHVQEERGAEENRDRSDEQCVHVRGREPTNGVLHVGDENGLNGVTIGVHGEW